MKNIEVFKQFSHFLLEHLKNIDLVLFSSFFLCFSSRADEEAFLVGRLALSRNLKPLEKLLEGQLHMYTFNFDPFTFKM